MHSLLILYLHVALPSGLFRLEFLTQILDAFVVSLCMLYFLI